VSTDTFNSENFVDYAQSAGSLSFLCFFLLVYLFKTDKSSSETTRETSFNFNAYRKISGNSPEKISDD
jgi:hypothetical protein